MIVAINTKVSGRGRYRVGGLFNSEYLKTFIELRLSRHSAVKKASASVVTGTVLVSFNSDNTHESIQNLLRDIIKEADQSVVAAGGFSKKDFNHKSGDKKNLRRLIKDMIFPPEEAPLSWHSMDVPAVIGEVSVDLAKGLSEETVLDRLKRYGPNALPESKPRTGFEIFYDQINSLPVYLLGAAAGVSILTGGLLDAAVIGGVVAANAVIGYFTENQAEKTIHSLKTFVRPAAEVIRDGEVRVVSAESIVKGDLIILKPGVSVPADCRIVSSDHLSIDESILTGESMPVSKITTQLIGENVPVADRFNMAFMGTLVTGGQGLAVAVSKGANTEIGQLQTLLGEITPPETPIERQLGQLGDQLVLMCGGVCGIVFGMGFFRGYGLLEMLRMSISLAAAAVPEGLPAAATINFALGIKRMRSHGVLIRQLQAVETLGAVQTVCMDKTGTITQNRMTVQKIYSGYMCVDAKNSCYKSDGKDMDLLKYEEFRRLFDICCLCSESNLEYSDGCENPVLCGSPTENALVQAAIDAGVDAGKVQNDYREIKVRQRSETRLYMSALHEAPDGKMVLTVKGSPPEVLTMCKWQIIANELVPLTEESVQEIETENEKMAGAALRVLGFAFRDVAEDLGEDVPCDLVWAGIVGMSDPIREGVNELIKVLHHAGIDTVMITGDQHSTAQAVASQLDIAREGPLEILDSSQLTALNPELFEAIAKKVHVYSRVSPAHKLRIVQALQSAGRTVGMTGDGINDGPALKAADIGIAMGRSGTDVAREVADVVLEEDNLEKLIVAVRDGRTIHSNVRKSVHFFLATNLSEIMIMFSSMAMGVGFPLNVMQLLWINIISDIFPGLALSMEEAEDSVMDQPPRDPRAGLFSRKDFKRMTLESAVITAGAMGAYGFGIARYGMGARASGIAFQGLTLGQLLHAFSCRSDTKTIFERNGLAPNRYLTWSLGISLALQALTIFFPPLRNFLGVPRLSALDTLVIGGSSVLPLLINEMTKKKKKD